MPIDIEKLRLEINNNYQTMLVYYNNSNRSYHNYIRLSSGQFKLNVIGRQSAFSMQPLLSITNICAKALAARRLGGRNDIDPGKKLHRQLLLQSSNRNIIYKTIHLLMVQCSTL